MNNNVKRIIMILPGCAFFIIGYMLNSLMSADMGALPPYSLINLAAIVVWFDLAFIFSNREIGFKQVLLFMHIVPLVMLVITAYFEFVQGVAPYWPQIYYSVLIWVKLPTLGAGLTAMCFSAFLTLALAAYAGCRIREAFIGPRE